MTLQIQLYVGNQMLRHPMKPCSCRHRLHQLAALVCLGVAIPFVVMAQNNNSAPAPLTAEAKVAIDKGIAAAKANNYLLAVSNFQDARKASPYAPEVFYDLGLAESKISGRELRAIAWFGAYLTSSRTMSNAAAVQAQINALDVTTTKNLKRLLKVILEQSVQPTISGEILPAAAGLLAEAGNVTDALKIIEQIPDHADGRGIATNQDSARLAVIESLVRIGEISRGQTMVGMLTNFGSQYTAELAIAQAQIEIGELAKARENLAQAMKISDKVKIPYRYNTSAKLFIAVIQIQMGDLSNAKNTLTIALKSIDPSEDTADKLSEQLEIARAQAFVVDTAGAQATLLLALANAELIPTTPKDTSKKDSQLDKIAQTQATIGDITAAKQTANRIQGKATRSKTVKDITDIYAKSPWLDRTAIQSHTQVPEVTVSSWMEILDNSNPYFDAHLNTETFLDFTSYLGKPPAVEEFSLALEPQDQFFSHLTRTAKDILTAQNTVKRMLKQMAAQQAKP